MTVTLRIKTPPAFNFSRTILSHGWCTLPPFRIDEQQGILERILRLQDGRLVYCTLRGLAGLVRVDVNSPATLIQEDLKDIRTQLRSCLRLDEDFSEFFREARDHPRFRWIPKTGAGRLLRAPTVFEDTVKMICTTNCSWALTEAMIRNLTGALGKPMRNGQAGFPEPEAIAGVSESFMRKNIRSGYRSPYLIELATRVAGNKLDIESWRTSLLPTEELFKEVRSVKGVGDYAAGNLLRLLGRYDYLALDSWVRGRYSTLHHKGRPVSDRTISRAYSRYGKWRGLLFWLEMTKGSIEDVLF